MTEGKVATTNRKKAVLIIDHDQLTLSVLKSVFQLRGFEVITLNGYHGFDKHMPLVDMVLCAHDLPFVSIKDLLVQMKAAWPDKRIFLSSALAFDDLSAQIHDSIDGLVSKPLNMEGLDALLARMAA